jgi:hypothetical protein
MWPRRGLPRGTQVLVVLVGKIFLDSTSFDPMTSRTRLIPWASQASQPTSCWFLLYNGHNYYLKCIKVMYEHGKGWGLALAREHIATI